jgi:cell division ATPase FtsA
MYATSVGLIMRGFDFLDTYKKTFNAGPEEEYMKLKPPVVSQKEEKVEEMEEVENVAPEPVHEEEKIPLTEKIKTILSKMFEVEDQPIK